MTGSNPLHVAVVWAADGPRLVAAAPTRGAVLERVADYVAAHAPDQLAPDDAARVAAHLCSDDYESAAHHYFAVAARRWDEERLHLGVVDLADAVVLPAPAAAPG